jgi:hypothetical protein
MAILRPFTYRSIEDALHREGVDFFDLGHADCGLYEELVYQIGMTQETAVGEGNWGDFRISLSPDLQSAQVWDGRGNTDEESYGKLLGTTASAAGAAALIRASLGQE